MPGAAAVRRSGRKSLTAISAAGTGEPWPFVPVFPSLPNMERASAPASRTAAFKMLSSMLRSSVSLARNGQTLHAHGRRVGAVAEYEVVGRLQLGENIGEISRDGHLAHRERERAV